MSNAQRIYGVVGWKNSGKTGLMERLVLEIRARGFTVSTVKHAHHRVDVDRPGTDSFRHREAGAEEVLLVSARRWALMSEVPQGAREPGLDQMLARLAPVDLVLIEGYKYAPHPKVEAHRVETGHPLIAEDEETVRAVASDAPDGLSWSAGPVLDLDDTATIAAFILSEVGLTRTSADSNLSGSEVAQ